MFYSKIDWIKTYDLGSTFTGRAYITMWAPMAYIFGSNGPVFYSSVPECVADPANYEIVQQQCDQIGGIYTTYLSATNSHNTITMYPAFSLQAGNDRTLRNVYSPQLSNTRDIPYYIPPSVVQNTIPRPVNIMFLFDGANATLSSFAHRAGFENAVQTGLVPADTLLVGISTWEYAIAGDTCQRNYELSFSVCDPTVSSSCPTGCLTGGTDKMLLFLNETVIPLLLSSLQMSLGEVSVVGGSMGGLTACYAPAHNPAFYVRGICFSPTPWNAGQLAGVVSTAFAHQPVSVLPKAMVLFMGAADADSLIGTPDTGYVSNGQLYDTLVQAWLAVGMQPFTPTTTFLGTNTTFSLPVEALSGPIDHVLSAIFQMGALHTTQSWEQYFPDALAIAFRPDFAANVTRLQKNDFARSLVLPAASGGSDDSVPVIYQQVTIGLAAALGVTLLCLVASCVFIAQLQKQLSQDRLLKRSDQMVEV